MLLMAAAVLLLCCVDVSNAQRDCREPVVAVVLCQEVENYS